ncbi:MAG TPA: ABC transporter ATP-binding protein [Roseiflexaceae bacterium]|nr:ABC transporter ATP-binding protein [Roseiflexaceae bacterium]
MSSSANIPSAQPVSRRVAWEHLASILRPWRATLTLVGISVLLSKTLDLAPPLLIQRIVDDHLTPQQPDGLLLLGIVYLGAIVAAQLLNFVAVYLTAVAAQGALHMLRVRLVSHLHRLPLSYYDQTPLGDVISRCTADVETVDTLFSTGVITLIANLVRLLTAAVAMVTLSRPLALVALLVIPPLVIITRWFQIRVRSAERWNRRAVGLLNTHLQETLSGVEVIQAFGREATFIARFRLALKEALAAFNRSAIYSALYSPIMALLSASVIALLLWLGTGAGMAFLGISIGTLTAFVLLFQRFFEPITTLGDDWQTVQSAFSGVERIFEVLALPAEERPNPQTAEHQYEAIDIRDLVFGYLPDRPVLRGMSLTVRTGEHVALVGRTGAGKSSMVHLCGGLYAPWSGTVQVAGRDPRSLVDAERRRIVGVVPQLVQLFSGTVRENLSLGDAAVSGEIIARAAAIAGAADFIEALPQGYDTMLSGSGRGAGVQLSSGQRQLLALARALIWDPVVLLLDEATAAIDSASDAALWAALRSDAAGQRRAVLTVAHRLTTARAADRVIVIEAGQIVEEGSPEELVRRGGRFAALVELEAAGWEM